MGRYIWVYSPKAVKVPEKLKAEIDKKLGEWIAILKKKYIKEIPKILDRNYIIDIYGKWIQNRFYLCSRYKCPKGYLSPEFENKFARLEYTGKRFSDKDNFQLFFLRHTGEWIKILEDKSLNKCIEEIKTSPWFVP